MGGCPACLRSPLFCHCAAAAGAAGSAGFVFELLSRYGFAWPGCLSLPTGGVVGPGPLPPLST